MLRLTVQPVLSTLGAAPDTYTGQRAMDLLATYPAGRTVLGRPDLVVEVVGSVLQLASRRRLRAFLQPDPFGRFVSVMVYLPRDRYTTDRRLAMQQILVGRVPRQEHPLHRPGRRIPARRSAFHRQHRSRRTRSGPT